MTWSDVAVAGAFVLGLGVGTVVSIRVMRNVMTYLKGEPPESDKG